MKRLVWCGLCLSLGALGCGDDAASGDTGPVDTGGGADAGPAACEGVDDGTPCGEDRVCSAEMCVDAGCGDGLLTDDEECDDMNGLNGDGCEADCTYSCTSDGDCDDGSDCSGVETCDVATHVCQAGTPLDCGDGDDCTEDRCDEVTGACMNPLIDMDGDGQASTDLGACGTDCDDTRDDVYLGAEELCDGVDNNCNVDIDEVAPTWYVDCDSDGFSANTGSSRTGCTEPPSSATGCDGAWTTRRPVDEGNTDCDDSNGNMFPGQTEYLTRQHSSGADDDERFGNYNCNGRADYSVSSNTGADGTCTFQHIRGTASIYCRGDGWAGSPRLFCGYGGSYYDCGEPVTCPIPGVRCTDYTLTCVGASARPEDPCYCPMGPCAPDCTPGDRGCAWNYYRCDDVTAGPRTLLACR